MSNRKASMDARVPRAITLTLLASRSQAQRPWTRKGIQKELARQGYQCSLRSVQRYINQIRGRGARE